MHSKTTIRLEKQKDHPIYSVQLKNLLRSITTVSLIQRQNIALGNI